MKSDSMKKLFDVKQLQEKFVSFVENFVSFDENFV